jgi:uncharacterized membrane protein (DUF2068 family)
MTPVNASQTTPERSSAKDRPKMHEPKPLSKRVGHSLLLIRLIAFDKVFKSACLVVVGIYILHMIHIDRNLHDTLLYFVNVLGLDENNRLIQTALQKTIGVDERTLHKLYVGTVIYAALYLIEGFGLYFDRGWAEWMTVITTAGFLPVEIMEIGRHVTILRVVVFISNVLMVIYLIFRIRWRHMAKMAGIDVKTDPEGIHEGEVKASAPNGNVVEEAKR